jgi:hypothetical protein
MQLGRRSSSAVAFPVGTAHLAGIAGYAGYTGTLDDIPSLLGRNFHHHYDVSFGPCLADTLHGLRLAADAGRH